MAKNIKAVVEEFARPIAEEMGFDYVDTEYAKQGTDWMLTIVIDKQGGVLLEDCERLSRAVEAVLDERDPISESYCLCVSSPGIDRPLKNARDFERNLGEMVDVKLYRSFQGKKEYTGVLRTYTEHSITVEAGDEEIVFELQETAKISPHIEF